MSTIWKPKLLLKETIDVHLNSSLLKLIAAYNDNKTKPAQEKIKEVYEKAVSIGYTPRQARSIIKHLMVGITTYQLTKHIPEAARSHRKRTPGRFWPSRGGQLH